MIPNLTTHQKEYDLNQLEKKKQEIQKGLEKGINVKFYTQQKDEIEEEFKMNTVGLVSREEFKRKAEKISDIMQQKNNQIIEQHNLDVKKKKAESRKKMKKQLKTLSF